MTRVHASDGALLGVRVTQHKETPGLGDYIEPKKDKNKERPWITQFNGLKPAATEEREWKVKKDGGRFDQFAGATIIGGLFLGLSRKAATEFSFFLAIPTLSAASLYSLWKMRHALVADDIGIFAVGFLASMISAFFAVRALLKFISTHTFIPFAWYRIAFGLLVLLTAWSGAVTWAV